MVTLSEQDSHKSNKANPNQSLVSSHPPTWYFEKPIYKDYNENDDIKRRFESHDTHKPYSLHALRQCYGMLLPFDTEDTHTEMPFPWKILDHAFLCAFELSKHCVCIQCLLSAL